MARMIDGLNIAAGFVPVNMATAANNGDWVQLKDYESLLIVLFKGAGASGEPPTLTVQQATAAAGTGAKALNFTRIYTKNNADVTTIGQWTETIAAAGNTYALAAGDTQAIVAIEIKGDDLDVTNGFCFVQGSVADVGATSQIGGVLYILGKPRYGAAPASLPTAIA